MQIFCSENPDAVPVETEPVAQAENLRRSMRKNVLLPNAALAVLILGNIALLISQWRRDPVGKLSDPVSLYSTLMYGLLALACLWQIGFYFRWSRRARLAVQNDGVFLPIRSKPIASWVLTAASTLILLLVYRMMRFSLGYWVLWLCGTAAIIVLGNLLKRYLKKRGVSRAVNLTVSSGGVGLLTTLFLIGLTAAMLQGGLGFAGGHNVVGTYELYGRTMEIYNDALPLEIEELAGVSAQWSKEADHQETFLLSSTEYHQYAVPVEGNGRVEERELRYTITEVKWSVLYDLIKGAALRARRDEIPGGLVFTDHYEPVDPSPWRAYDAYQHYWSSSVLNEYLLFRGNHIVEIHFYWEPTPKQIASVAEKLERFFAAGAADGK